MFHVQLRQFPHVARAFNLSREQLDSSLLRPWVAGNAVHLQERRWAPDRAQLTIYEGPALQVQDIGLGRGWANVTRLGEDVTAQELSKARGVPGTSGESSELKAAILARCGSGPLRLGEVVALAGSDRLRASGRLAAAEQAVWELLDAGTVRLVRNGDSLAPGQWQAALLRWAAWTDPALVLEAGRPG